jgi:ribosomal protein S18 acetylase RimI-like enzyme
MRSGGTVHRVTPMAYAIQPADVAKAADVLSASFADYPVFQHVMPDEAGRGRKLAHVFRFLVRLGLTSGEVIAPSEGIEGVSIWFRSEGTGSSALTAFRAGLLGLYLRVGHGAVARLIQVSATKSRARAKLLSRPYCLLDMIGVEPSLQGRGLARKMLDEKLGELDGEHLPCYLETSRPGTARYYERFGFELVHQYRFASMDVFCLLREVGAGS